MVLSDRYSPMTHNYIEGVCSIPFCLIPFKSIVMIIHANNNTQKECACLFITKSLGKALNTVYWFEAISIYGSWPMIDSTSDKDQVMKLLFQSTAHVSSLSKSVRVILSLCNHIQSGWDYSIRKKELCSISSAMNHWHDRQIICCNVF